MFLVCISILAVPLFLFTRAMAERNRAMHERTAEFWYEDGRRLIEGGNVGTAIESLRKAATNDHDNSEYRLALARALARAENFDEARTIFVQSRDAAPENGEVNLDLARLEAQTGNIPGAVRYYRSALYGIWPEGDIDDRRREVRLELIDFLLEQQETNTALSELLMFSRDIGEDAEDHVTAGRMFIRAGEPARAMNQFLTALRSDRNSATALAGAGEAAFMLGNYAAAVRYLRPVAEREMASESALHDLAVSELVLSLDPLAPRLAIDNRSARLQRGFTRAKERIDQCIAERQVFGDDAGAVLSTLSIEAAALEEDLTTARIRRNQDLIDSALALIFRIELAADELCSAGAPVDESLLLIARLHGLAENEQTRQ
jgi:Flp pilus assembly protein TadD